MPRLKRVATYPEPGAWVVKTGIPPPGLLPEGKLSAGMIRDDYVAYEGLRFCIYSPIPANRIADPKLRNLWTEAHRAMGEVIGYLERSPQPTGPRRNDSAFFSGEELL